MKQLKIAIIGCGNIAKEKHIPNLLLQENVVITALYDYNKENAVNVNKEFLNNEANVYDTFDELLESKNIDICHICTPNALHAPMSIKAMKKGKHVMCEKPMAMDSSEAKEMVETSIATNRYLGISLQNRFRKDCQYLKKMLDNNELGDIYYAKAHALRRRAVPVWGDFLNKKKQGGGALIDIGVHALDLTLWLMDKYEVDYVIGKTYKKIGQEPTDFNNLGDWDPSKFEVDESAFAQIVMKDGSSVNLEASWALNTLNIGEAKTTLHGTLAGADMNNGLTINGVRHGQQFVYKPQLTKEELQWYDDRYDDAGFVEMKTWIESIRNQVPYVVQPQQVYIVTRIIEAIYESSETNKPVYLGEWKDGEIT